MVDRRSGTWWTAGTDAARPGSPQEGPARSAATATSLAERSAGGPCGPTGASVSASRSRCRLAQIEGSDPMSAEQQVEATILVCRTQRNATAAEGSAELDRP